jgi:RNA polymerase-binding protein DksA
LEQAQIIAGYRDQAIDKNWFLGQCTLNWRRLHMAVEKKKKTEKAADSRRSAPKVDWPDFVKKMEQSLQEQKSELIENLIANNKDFKEIVEGMDPKDFADIASDDVDRKMIEALGSQELKQLKLIDSALTRISQGKYGHCIKCEKRIPPDRLEAIPYALMCVECKSEEERRNR